MTEISTIKFSGGDSAIYFSVDENHERVEREGHNTKGERDVGTKIQFAFIVASLGIKSENKLGHMEEGEEKSEHHHGKSKASQVGFYLGDPDTGDVFDVDVFRDPHYGSFMFHTVSGYSLCPGEEGTYHREQPGISLKSAPVSPVMPDDTAIFEILLENNGQEYTDLEFFEDHVTNGNGLNAILSGDTLVQAVVFHDMAPGTVVGVLQIKRGPTLYKYPPLRVGFRSTCDAARFMETGNLYRKNFAEKTLELNVEFVQPCSQVRLASTLADDMSFHINHDDTLSSLDFPNQVMVVAFNPDRGRRWGDDDRLEKVQFEYRSKGGTYWKRGLNIDGQVIDLTHKESEFGYADDKWFVAALPDGEYEVRFHAICMPSPGGAPPGIDENFSESVWGVVDREAPRQFGLIEPADGEYFPGDEISVSFDEPIYCSKPYRFRLSLEVEGLDRRLDETSLVVVCEHRKISIGFRPNVSYKDLMGKSAKLHIDNVEDLNKNAVSYKVEAHFKFAAFNAAKASMQLEGVYFNVTFQDGMNDDQDPEFKSVASGISGEIAKLIGVARSRVVVTSIKQAGPGINVDIDIAPPAEDAAEQTASADAVDKLKTELKKIEENPSSTTAQSMVYLNTVKPEALQATMVPSASDAALNSAMTAAGGSAFFGSDSSGNTNLWLAVTLLSVSTAVFVLSTLFVINHSRTKEQHWKELSKLRLAQKADPEAGFSSGKGYSPKGRQSARHVEMVEIGANIDSDDEARGSLS